jgi:hypothetical protein
MAAMDRHRRSGARKPHQRRLGVGSDWQVAAIGAVELPTFDDGTTAVRVAPMADVLAAFERLPDASWETMRDLIRPIFPRLRQFPFPMDFVSRVVPPGLTVGFAADVGPSFVHVHRGMLDDWGVDLDSLAEVAFTNLRACVVGRGAGNLVREPVGGVPTIAYQSGEGWASTLLLVPDLIDEVLGPGDRFFVAPMRDLLIDLPPGVEPEFASWLTSEFEALDPNALCLEGFLYQDRRLSIVPLQRGAIPA